MSVYKFGRLTPVQAMMLGLIGYKLTRNEATLEIPDAERLDIMRRAREQLVQLTDNDYGFAVLRWHNCLSQNDAHEHTHPHAYASIKQALSATQKDSQRIIEKYFQPNPPRMGPRLANNEGILEVWQWAEAAHRKGMGNNM